MVFFWLLFLSCAVCAWLIGYGMGYVRGIRDTNTITADVSDGDSARDFSGQ